MYDIVSKSIKNDTLYLTCFHDKEDSELWFDFENVSDTIFNKALQNVKKILDTIVSFSVSINKNTYSIKAQYKLLPSVKALNFSQIFYTSKFLLSVFQPPENHKYMI